jgi:8-oxo-dGTP pyrophosphatase MutT (NUDIX family)
MNSSKNICLNCGKTGHMVKSCYEPVVSFGIICFKISNELNVGYKNIENYFYNKFVDICEFNYQNLENIKYIPIFYDKIKILLIKRKNSLNFIEFIRGKYDVNDKDHLNKMFKFMTKEENNKIKSTDFETLWNELWKETAKNKSYQKEFNTSKNKFEELIVKDFYSLLDESNISEYLEPEWGFPKGRRNIYEKNIDCAIREFYEETNYSLSNIHILERINCLDEEYEGSNHTKYKHVYYVAHAQDDYDSKLNEIDNYYEIGEIGWFTIPEALEKIRPYYDARIKIIHQLYFFIINLINVISKNIKSIEY